MNRLISRAMALVKGKIKVFTDEPHDLWLKNGTAATTVAVGDLLMLDRATLVNFEYTQVILPTTAGIAGTAAQVFCVAQTAGAVGSKIRCRFEGDTLLKMTTNAAADTNLTGTNASVEAADAATGNIILGWSKEAGSGVKRAYFNGFGIAVSA